MTRQQGLRWLPTWAALALLLFAVGNLFAQASNLPPKPDRYVTDQAGVLAAGTASAINNQLEQFEKDTSNQILVAIYPNLPADAEIAQYATDTFNAWKPGQQGKDNGAILFIFINDRKMFIATGRGLEGALPDAICKNIITQVVAPQFKQGNYADGIQGGVNAMLAAAKGEYKGTGSTMRDGEGDAGSIPSWVIILIFILFVLANIFIFPRFQGPVIYSSGGWGGGSSGGWGGGGGGFSGGGGSSAGGGAGGSW